MKKFGIFLAVWVTLLLLVYLLHSEDKTETKSKSEVCIQIESLEVKYNNKLFKAFYSIDELRPFSIVQIDKILELYDNTWISPVLIVAKLDSKDKELLRNRVVEYIESFEDNSKRKMIIQKLINWCKADSQFEFMNQELGIFNENILRAIELNFKDNSAVATNSNNKVKDITELTSEQREFAYYQALNMISSMNFNEQLSYYGKIYVQLAGLNDK